MRTQKETDLEQEVERLTNELREARAALESIAATNYTMSNDARAALKMLANKQEADDE